MSERWFFKSFGLSEITGVFHWGDLIACRRRENSFSEWVSTRWLGPGQTERQACFYKVWQIRTGAEPFG
jgi:hypothetical protein